MLAGDRGPADLGADIEEAARRLEGVVARTPLQASKRLSTLYGARVFIKREDLQEVRSFKIRGAYNKIASLSAQDRKRGMVCASAGNHAQGVAFACAELQIKATIFMPAITPTQKIDRVKHFGSEFSEIRLVGNSYDDADAAAQAYCEEKQAVFVHPFDDRLTIAGQGTIGKEIYEDLAGELDVVVAAVGGGGLASGIASYVKRQDPTIAVIGAEPAGCPSMSESLRAGVVVPLDACGSVRAGSTPPGSSGLPATSAGKRSQGSPD